MASSIKPIKLYGKLGPNPIKVNIILDELKIPYEIVDIQFSEVKGPQMLAVNPNGRMPAIYDPNTDITLWESGAIIEYLIDHYDKEHRLSFAPGSADAYHAKQWLYYQTTGQGPYYGQAVWFTKYHAEKVPSAVERYVGEINRVTGVLEGWLVKQKEANSGGDGPWLVGNKLSYADIAFLPWQGLIGKILTVEQYNVDKYPEVKAWIDKLLALDSAKALKSH